MIIKDDLLRVGLKGMATDEADERVEAIISIFRYISDKDVFELYYRQHLGEWCVV